MSLNAQAIAVSGYGFGAQSIAVSGYSESTVVSRLKYWNGSTWQAKVLKNWNGSIWQTKTLKRWNGSTWIQ